MQSYELMYGVGDLCAGVGDDPRRLVALLLQGLRLPGPS
ncbi:hypothetical protein SHL15_8556 [Streptomyces hygroscopicus subsp. limoneus]|nr:hypothetical protein SHL15_8556 [Streptomyces hygroscopicus subsp. limoneus]